MDDKSQKERLEQELMFLKESFDAEVISQEEYEKGKQRIERKLKEIQGSENKRNEQEKSDVPKEEQVKAEEAAKEAEIDEAIESREENSIKLKVIQEVESVETQKEETKEPSKEEEPQKTETELQSPKSKSKFTKYAVILVVLVIVVFLSYSLLKSTKGTEEIPNGAKFVAVCNSDNDCKKEGYVGFCLNPAATNAKCDLKEMPKNNVIILNGRKDCFNCDSARILSILESWFGTLNAKEIDYATNQGESLADKINAKMLPAYILEESIEKEQNFEQFKQAFVKKGSNYVLSDAAAAPTFYLSRESMPNKLELFVSSDTSDSKAEKNLKEFLEAFKDVKFEKHFANDKITEELGIKSFPTFLVNNRVKFSGVQTAETIKNNFCRMNKLAECEKSLSKNLI